MKKNKLSQWVLMACAIIISLNSCSFGEDDKNENEIVDDPMAKTEVYYIVGTVFDAETTKGLADVEVKIGDETVKTDNNGIFEFAVKEKKEYEVAFSKANYVTIETTATIASNAANRSMVTLGIKMTPTSSPVDVTVTKNGDVVIVTDKGTEDECTAHISLPPNTVTKDCSISITPYDVPAPVSTTVKPGIETIPVSLKNLSITASHNEFNKSLRVTIRNIGCTNAYFDTDKMQIWHNNQDANTRAAEVLTPDNETIIKFDNGNYHFETAKLKSKYALRIETEKETGAENNTEYNLVNGKNELKVDNSGNTSAMKDVVIKIEAKAGWNYTTSPTDALKSAGITGNDLDNMAATISRVIEAQEGGFPGYYTVNQELKTNVSGNHIMYYRNKAKFSEKTYTFDIVVKGNKNTKASVKVKAYTGREDLYQNVDATQHSGGSI